MNRADKLKKVETFFATGEPIKKQGYKIVLRELHNGKPIEPPMNDDEFNNYVEDLKKQYENVFVWYEHKQYEDKLL
jgi:hypothetical protein